MCVCVTKWLKYNTDSATVDNVGKLLFGLYTYKLHKVVCDGDKHSAHLGHRSRSVVRCL